MKELVTKEVKDGDSLLHDVCKVLRTSAWLDSSDEPLTSEQLCLKFSTQISSLELVYERFKPLFPNHVNPLKLQTQYLLLVKVVALGNFKDFGIYFEMGYYLRISTNKFDYLSVTRIST